MIDVLPPQVVATIQEHYQGSIEQAERHYLSSAADEDAITGALGQAMQWSETRVINGVTYRIRTSYKKLGGRGRGALEKKTGADGIFLIEVRDEEGNVLAQKGLIFQAKNDWRGVDRRLSRQSEQLAQVPNGAIVIDYRARGYSAVPADVVARVQGNRSDLPEGVESGLAETLAKSFVPCKIGRRDIVFDAIGQVLYLPDSGGKLIGYRFPVRHRIRTRVLRRSQKWSATPKPLPPAIID